MMATNEGPRTHRDVAVPTSALSALRHALRREAGPLAAVHALQAAGFEAGQDLYGAFETSLAGPPSEMEQGRFWRELGSFFQRRGWGTLVHDPEHPAVGVLRSADWAESGGDEGESQPSCSFTSGLLSGFLSRLADGDIAVLQVACRSQGDDACAFAFGSEPVIRDLYGLLLDGTDFASALREL